MKTLVLPIILLSFSHLAFAIPTDYLERALTEEYFRVAAAEAPDADQHPLAERLRAHTYVLAASERIYSSVAPTDASAGLPARNRSGQAIIALNLPQIIQLKVLAQPDRALTALLDVFPDVVQVMQRAIRGSVLVDESIRVEFSRTLQDLKPKLFEMLSHKQFRVRECALYALADSSFLGTTQQEESNLRQDARFALRNPLEKSSVRKAAAYALGGTALVEDDPRLEVLAQQDPEILSLRIASARSLVRILAPSLFNQRNAPAPDLETVARALNTILAEPKESALLKKRIREAYLLLLPAYEDEFRRLFAFPTDEHLTKAYAMIAGLIAFRRPESLTLLSRFANGTFLNVPHSVSTYTLAALAASVSNANRGSLVLKIVGVLFEDCPGALGERRR